MRLNRVRLLNYRGVACSDVSFSPSGVTIVEGQNEVGKTSIAEALQLAIELPDSSQHSDVKSVKPVDRDAGPEVEIHMTTGPYEFVYRKRWLRRPETTLEVSAPHGESCTGREAHDRAKAILGETLDEDLWAALRIEQGTELNLPKFDLPSMGKALDRAAGGDIATDREDTLWDRIGDEYDKYWTRTGQTGRELRSLEQRVEEAQKDVSELNERLGEIESDTNQMIWLVADASRLAVTRTECEKQESELTKRWDSAERLRIEIERLTAVYDAAEAQRSRAVNEQHSRQELINTLDRQKNGLAGLRAEVEQSAPTLTAATRHSEKAEVALDDARSALRCAESRYWLATEDRDYRRRKIEVAQLKERHERYEEAAKTLREAEDFLESVRVDDDLVYRIEQAYLEDERAKVAADSAAASVETTALRDLTLHVDDADERVELAANEVNRMLVVDEVVLVIPNIARMRVSAGPESRGLADRRGSSHEILQRLCDEGGVADLAEARTVAQKRREAQRNCEEATKAIKRDLRDLTPEILLDKVKGLSKRVATYLQERPEDPPLPSDFEEAKRVASEMEPSFADWKVKCGTCEDAAKNATDALHKAQVSEKVLAARIKDARISNEDAAATLATARENRADEVLTTALVVAEKKADDARKSLEGVKAELKAADPDSLDALRDNAREALKRAIDDLQSNKEHQYKLQSSLDFRGEEGLHTLHDEALNQVRRVKGEYSRVNARAEAARLLRETFEKRRRQARQRYVEPFKERIDRLGRIVFGPTFAVEVDNDLRITRRTLDGITLDVEQLSTGAREQIGVLSRLACAAIVSPDDGGAPVMIDDALGWSDPQRLQSMGAAIAAAGRQCQVIVLTCTPGRYANVGRAKVVTLGR